MRYLIALLLALPVLADKPVDLSWDAPTKNVDGTDVPPTGPLALKEYQLSWTVTTLLESEDRDYTSTIVALVPVTNVTVDFAIGCRNVIVRAVSNNLEVSEPSNRLQLCVYPSGPPTLRVVSL